MARCEGDVLVVRSREALPGRCVRCGQRTTFVIHRTFYWHPAWVYVFVPAGLLPYAVAALALRKQIALAVPLCADHRRERTQRINGGGFTCIGAFGLGYLIAKLPGDTLWLAFAATIIAFTVGAVIALRAGNVLSVKRIVDDEAWLSGACDEFLDVVEPRDAS